jgi:hypothetical protein
MERLEGLCVQKKDNLSIAFLCTVVLVRDPSVFRWDFVRSISSHRDTETSRALVASKAR